MTDYTVGDTFHIAFTTRSFSTGAPTVLAGTPVVSVYEDASLIQITAGVTLGVDHDSVAGLNMITLVATGGNGFESGKDYHLVITTGTVGGVSVVGEVVGRFTLERSAAAVDLANGTDGLGAIKADTAAVLVDTAEIGTAGVGLTDLGGMSTGMKAEVNVECDTSLTDYDGPTNAQMEARTLVSASYFDPAADTVANVTTVATTTMNTDMRGTDSAGVNAEMLDVLTTDTFAEVSSVPAATSSILDKLNWLFTLGRNKITQTSTTQTLRNDADAADVATATVSDDGSVFIRDEYT